MQIVLYLLYALFIQIKSSETILVYDIYIFMVTLLNISHYVAGLVLFLQRNYILPSM